MSDDNVVNFGKVGLTPKKKDTKAIFCRHYKIVVREQTRDLQCDTCEMILDPFDFLFKWANKQQNIFFENRGLKYEIEEKKKQLERLKKDVVNMRAKANRLKEVEK